ncbi:MAG: hypothetical protein Q4C95_01545 [Planctomycetia bacterium]|nr:hypothetical protein [Planctomycetia bacterium]
MKREHKSLMTVVLSRGWPKMKKETQKNLIIKTKRILMNFHCRFFVILFLLFAAIEILTIQTGCTRKKYRESADKDVYGLLNTVNQQDPLWKMQGFTLQENSNSRYANRYNPDAQPMPQDDKTSHRLMQIVDGKKGSQKWYKNGSITSVENELWRNTLPYDENGNVVITQDTAFDLALMHSPNYRTAMENIYEAALSVSEQRFVFDVQFYGNDSLFYNNNGGFRDDSTSSLSNSFQTGANKKLATGADIVVGLANSLVWTFSPSNDTFVPTTRLSYSITQPFLRGAGRAIVLENLTQSERRLLANVRQLAFYQQGFYLGVLTGSSPVSAPSGGMPGTGVNSPSLGGFYGLLATQVEINNQRSNVASLQTNLRRYEEYFLAGRLSRSEQVERVRESFLSGQSSLLSSMNNYQSSVENYLISLGLPPDIDNVIIYSPLLDQFQLMPAILEKLYEEVNVQISILRGSSINPDDEPAVRITDDMKTVLADFKRRTEEGQKETLNEMQRLKQMIPERKKIFNRLYERLESEKTNVDRSFCNLETGEFDRTIERIETDYHGGIINHEIDGYYTSEQITGVEKSLKDIYRLIELTLLSYDKATLSKMIVETRETPDLSPFPQEVINLVYDLQLDDFFASERNITSKDDKKLTATSLEGIWEIWFTTCLTKLANELMSLQLIQARVRLQSIFLPIIDVNSDQAFRVASEYRLDWMNARANLVDQWRNIEIVADNLKGVLDLNVRGDIANEGSNMLNFSAKESSFSAGLEFDTPLSNLSERNAYRRALISYDQARRSYYAYVDNVNRQIRSTIRLLELNQMDFELQRIRVESSIKNVHQCQLALEEPAQSSNIGSVSDTAAQNLVDALTSLLQSQNSFMQVWLNYQIQRMGLLLELGLFEIDETGRWIDPGDIDTAFLDTRIRGVEESQDELSGLNDLPEAEELRN